MESLNCPACGDPLNERLLGTTAVHQCPAGHGVWLARADLGTLVESETDWHAGAGHHTAPLPKITADMTVPPAATPRARAWVETLFG